VKTSERGFTSIEIIVTLTIGMTLAGFIYTSNHFSIRMMRRWEEKMGMDQIAWVGLDKMSRDLTGARSIRAAGDSSLSITDGEGGSVLYRFSNGCLFRNGTQLNNPPMVVYQWKAAADTIRNGALVELEWTVGNPKHTVSLRTAVYCRNMPGLKGYKP
jgi:hypothetical protein